MFRASLGGGAASRTAYRHSILHVMTPLLAPLAAGLGWSNFSLAAAAILMG